MGILSGYYNLSKTKLFIGMVLINFVIMWLSRTLLINEIVFYNTYSEQLTYTRSLEVFESLKKISWIGYAFYPIVLFVKISFISIVLYTGIFLCNLHFMVTFGTVFKVAIASEMIFIFAGILKFLWFYLLAGSYDLNEMAFFYPFSLTNLFEISEVDKIWIYPLQMINLFQFIYIFLLSYGLNNIGHIVKSESDKIVLVSYLPALVLWIILIMFLSIDSTL